MVAFSAILDNFAGAPFTPTWTIRIWRAPRVTVDLDSPWVINPPTSSDSGVDEYNGMRTRVDSTDTLGPHMTGQYPASGRVLAPTLVPI